MERRKKGRRRRKRGRNPDEEGARAGGLYCVYGRQATTTLHSTIVYAEYEKTGGKEGSLFYCPIAGAVDTVDNSRV